MSEIDSKGQDCGMRFPPTVPIPSLEGTSVERMVGKNTMREIWILAFFVRELPGRERWWAVLTIMDLCQHVFWHASESIGRIEMWKTWIGGNVHKVKGMMARFAYENAGRCVGIDVRYLLSPLCVESLQMASLLTRADNTFDRLTRAIGRQTDIKRKLVFDAVCYIACSHLKNPSRTLEWALLKSVYRDDPPDPPKEWAEGVANKEADND